MIGVLILALCGPGGAGADDAPPPSWPQFRGAHARGVDDSSPLPLAWSVPEGKGVLWRVKVPGLGHSSPVIWGQRIFLTTAVRVDGKQELRVGLYGDIRPVSDEGAMRWKVLCLDRRDGALLWDRVARQGVPRIKRHTKGTHANSTPAVDGQRVIAFFGSEGLYAYDLEGKLLWKKDLGVLDSGFYRVPAAQWGFGSSPVLHEGKVIVQCDVQKGSFLAVLDATDGSEIWRAPRDEIPTWSTPTVHAGGGTPQVIVNGYRQIGGYALADGSALWRMRGGGDIPVPTPVIHSGIAYITSAHGPERPIYAVRLSAREEIAPGSEEDPGDAFAWYRRRAGNYMQTPIVYRDLAYFCTDSGILSRYDAASGERHTLERLGGGGRGFTASPVAGDGKLYFTSEDGEVFVVRAGKAHEVLARNPVGEVCMSTPAIVEGALIFRTQGHLVAVGSGEPSDP